MGFSRIIGIALLVNEQYQTLKNILQLVRKRNSKASASVKCFMTDKDLTERKAIIDVFPGTQIYLCEFHVLKVFSRTITIQDMSITAKQKDEALTLLDKIVKSKSKEEYDYLYSKICEDLPKSVKDYFNQNWHGCKNEWTHYALSENNFGNYTNNQVESTNASLKRGIKLNSTLKDFINNFFVYHRRRNSIIKVHVHDSIYKHPVHSYEIATPEYNYKNLLTEIAFKKLIVQLQRRNPMTLLHINDTYKTCLIKSGFRVLNVGIDTCECINFIEDKLPCRHIFAVRQNFRYELFDANLCHRRWKKSFNFENQRNLSNPSIMNTSETLQSPQVASQSNSFLSKNNTHCVNSQAPKSAPQRLRAMKEVAGNLAHLGSMVTKTTFTKRLHLLKMIEDAWRQNIEIELDQPLLPISSFENLSLIEEDSNDDNIDPSNIIMP